MKTEQGVDHSEFVFVSPMMYIQINWLMPNDKKYHTVMV